MISDQVDDAHIVSVDRAAADVVRADRSGLDEAGVDVDLAVLEVDALGLSVIRQPVKNILLIQGSVQSIDLFVRVVFRVLRSWSPSGGVDRPLQLKVVQVVCAVRECDEDIVRGRHIDIGERNDIPGERSGQRDRLCQVADLDCDRPRRVCLGDKLEDIAVVDRADARELQNGCVVDHDLRALNRLTLIGLGDGLSGISQEVYLLIFCSQNNSLTTLSNKFVTRGYSITTGNSQYSSFYYGDKAVDTSLGTIVGIVITSTTSNQSAFASIVSSNTIRVFSPVSGLTAGVLVLFMAT